MTISATTITAASGTPRSPFRITTAMMIAAATRAIRMTMSAERLGLEARGHPRRLRRNWLAA